MTTEIFTRAAFVLVHPFRTSFKVTPKDGIDDGGWAAARQLRLVLVVAAVLAAAMAARALALAGVVPLPPLRALAVTAGLTFAGWELVVIAAACGGSPAAIRSAATSGSRWRWPAWSTARWSGSST